MYLKKIEMHGFKSFADKSVIEFEPGITGIVGPNGCGKSNINDAIRWVLGEQSVKSLRGKSMSDVIFAGSEDRKPQNVAEVTLVFDNSDRYIDSDYTEIEITRRLYRDNNEAEYLLNNQQCRLKDIIDLLMDTGLGRDSLSIISQGNISSFADSKPEDRRAMFEEAAGVAKYKKRKLEAIRRLERTTNNLERIEDIVYELEKQLQPLVRQKHKAEIYLGLKEELHDIEISLIVKESTLIKSELDQIKVHLTKLEMDDIKYQTDIQLIEQKTENYRVLMLDLDKEVNTLQGEYMKAMDDVSTLESRKAEVDSKRKYMLENHNIDNIEEQIEEIKLSLNESLLEYNDRVERYQKANQEINDLKQEVNALTHKQVSNQQVLNEASNKLQNHRNQKTMLLDYVENKNHYQVGVRAIMNAKKSLHGIYGVVSDLIEVDDGYEQAISVALGNASQFIICESDESARNAISFLKQNKAGRATFLPLNRIQGRNIQEQAIVAAQSISGFLGIATSFVHCNKQFNLALSSQLGNVLIAENLESANEISKMVYARYKVVTLQGDVVNVGGSMSGGAYQNNHQSSSFLQRKELERINEVIPIVEKEVILLRNQAASFDTDLKAANNQLLQKQIGYAKLEEVVRLKLNKLEGIKADYESLTNQKVEVSNLSSSSFSNELIESLNHALRLKDELTEKIRTKRELRMQYVNENDELTIHLSQIRKHSNQIQKDIMQDKIEITRFETLLTNHLQRLNQEYKMTFEYAIENFTQEIDVDGSKQKVEDLRLKINELGHVNLEAIEQYEDVHHRYTTLNEQRLDLLNAQDAILKAIKEMDIVMEDTFSETFDKINQEFNFVFRRLFGGGKAKLLYSDPTNILESGIDIEVQPPGKSVQNITLFSGGEKALIALSGLFAILRARPIPMCLLDEVEAALDQANVERFAKFLKDFAEETQFIVVTHRPGTMEQCDALFGATMQEKGVTKLIGVQLKAAIDLVNNE